MATWEHEKERTDIVADEPVFILRAQDIFAPEVIDLWAEIARANNVNNAKCASAEDVAEEMRIWSGDKGAKKPD